ncbi:hypothetical protein [Halorussus halophilus]|uniref:hypothetical protein n=1 Tax=Halorussus halophilus TaxID=2650975 RepID=UPI001787C38D|nr:hypothetical protein [Halorussus halophilus]
MSGDSDDRAEKLAGRWGPESDSETETEGDDSESGTSDVEEVASASDDIEGTLAEQTTETPDDSDGDELTTREMQSQMLYLDPELYRELDLTFEELKLRYRRERDDKLQKNKDFYAGLLRLGLAQLGDVRERELDEIEDDLDL